MKKRNQRLLAVLLALLMTISLLPTAAFAAVGSRALEDDPVPLPAPAAEADAATPVTDSPSGGADLAVDDPAEAEIPAQLSEVTNIARGKSIIDVSGTLNDSFNPANMVDGNTATQSRWVSTWNLLATPAYFTVDLGEDNAAWDVTSININWFSNGWATAFTIETSSAHGDDATWTSVYSGSGSAETTSLPASALSQTTLNRYVRFKFTELNAPNNDSNGSIAIIELEINGTPQSSADVVNLARLDGVTATDDNHEEGTRTGGIPYNLNGAQTIDGIKSGSENNNSGHWSTNQNPGTVNLTVDLGATCTINEIKLFWKHNSVTAYTIALSSDGVNYGDPIKTQSERVELEQTITLASPAQNIRSVKLTVTACDDQGTSQWANVNLWEIEIYGAVTEAGPTNVARLSGVDVECSQTEGYGHTADKAIDGDRESNASRWTTGNDDKGTTERSLQLDLHRRADISRFELYWNERNAIDFVIETSLDGKTWTPQVTVTGQPNLHDAHQVFELEEPVNARHLRLRVTKYGHAADYPTYYNVSLYEFEAYGVAGEVIPSAATIRDAVKSAVGGDNVCPVEVQGGKVVLKQAALDALPEGGVFEATFASNLEQVVGPDGAIHTPLVDKTVDIDLTVTNVDDGDSAFYTTSLTIPGVKTANEGNAKPDVIPELMEWYSSAEQSGKNFTLTANSKIIHRPTFDSVARELDADLHDLFPDTFDEVKSVQNGASLYLGHTHNLLTYAEISNAVQPGDIVIYNVEKDGIAANLGKVEGFDNETYRIEISDHVTIYATDATGAYWATRTLLQALKLSQAADGTLTVPQGTTRDYPEFKVRGFTLDVGRKPMSMAKLQEFAKNMAWYKMNDFHVHLSDNLIFMEDYKQSGEGWWDNNDAAYKRANNAYSAFRLESGLQEEDDAVASLTAKDYHYTKAEYKAFVEHSKEIGVTIVSEIDVPAHAKAITDAFPSVRLRGAGGHPYNDHLDLTNNYEASLAVTKKIFDEYIDSGVFGSAVHFGADEYYDSHPAYRRFVKDMIEYLNSKPNLTTKRLWGSLGPDGGYAMKDQPTEYPLSEIDGTGIQMNIWSTGWAQPAMAQYGFGLINILDGSNYIVPGPGGSYSPNGLGHGRYNWDPDNFGGTKFPASSSQMLGGSYGIWNDCIDTRANGVDEQGIFYLFFDSLPYYACALWGRGSKTLAQAEEAVEILDTAPGTNPYHEVALKDGTAQYARYTFTGDKSADLSGNGRDLTLVNASVQKGSLSLKGSSSYAETGVERLPWGSRLSFRAFKVSGGGEEQILFESDAAYDEYTIKAVPVEGKDTVWKLGFSRELYDYVYDVELPVGEWVTLELVNDRAATTLYFDGQEYLPTGSFLSNENSNTQFRGRTFTPAQGASYLSTPFARIGSATNAFVGYLDDISIAPATVAASEIGKYDIPLTDDNGANNYAGATAGTNQSGAEPAKALDGDNSSVWHTTHSVTCEAANRWFQIELTEQQKVAGLSYLPRPTGSNGIIDTFRIEVKTDGGEWEPVVENGKFREEHKWQSVQFDAVDAKYVKIWADQTYGDKDGSLGKYISAAEFRLMRPINWDEDGDNSQVSAKLDEVSFVLTDGGVEPLPLVTFDGAVLVKDQDYTLEYAGHTAAGETDGASVTVKPSGAYTGNDIVLHFTVTAPPAKTDLSSAKVEFPLGSYPLENGVAKPDPTVTVGGVTLRQGLDYEVTYSDNNDTVGATVTATVTGKGDYEGTKTATFTVAAAIVKKDLSKATVTLGQDTYIFSGEPQKPIPTVVLNGEEVPAANYTVTYFANTNVGTGRVTVTGKAPYYTGSASAFFTIVAQVTAKDLSDRSKISVTFAQDSYPLVGGKAEPSPIVTYEGELLVKGTDYTVRYFYNTSPGSGMAVIDGKEPLYTGSFAAVFAIDGTGGGGSSSGGSNTSSGDSASNTSSNKQADGGTVKKAIDDAGVITTQTSYPNGAQVAGTIGVDGLVTAAVSVPDRADKVTVTVPTRGPATAGQVAVILRPDGSQEVVKTSLPTEDGVQLTLTDDAIVQIVDNAKDFVDVPDNNWAAEAIDFVTAREIFNGTGNQTFTPNGAMSRAMVCTVLANLAGEDTKGGAVWYEKGLAWAKENDVSDGTNPEAIVTREQLATMLYRYAGSPAVGDVELDFVDADTVSDWAAPAIAWAVANGLLKGRDGVALAPLDTATRAEVATVFQRYVALLSK